MEEKKIKTVPFMVDIPENTLDLVIAANIYLDGEVRTCVTEIKDMGEIRKGMIAGEEYDEANAVYELSDEVKKRLGIE